MNSHIQESASRFLRAGKSLATAGARAAADVVRNRLDETRTLRKRQRRQDRDEIDEALREMEAAGIPVLGGA